MKLARILNAAAFAVLVSAFGCSSTDLSAGHDARTDLVSTVHTTTQDLKTTQASFRQAIEKYNFLLQLGDADAVAAYQQFAQSIQPLSEHLQGVQNRMREMDAASETYFENWQADLSQFKGDGVRKRAEQRLLSMRERFENVQNSINPTYELAGQFLADMQDQMLFLKHDLSAETMSAVREDSLSVNEHGDELLASLEIVMKFSNSFVQAAAVSGPAQPQEKAPDDNQTEVAAQ